MKDPKRLYEDEASPVAAILLRGGRADLPDRARIDRIVAGVVGAGSALASGSAGATALSLSAVVQWFAVGAVAGVVASSTVYVFQGPTAAIAPKLSVGSPVEASSTTAPGKNAPGPAASVTREMLAEVPEAKRHAESSRTAERDATEPSRVADASSPASTLAAEAAALARAKAALDRNAPAEALAAVRAYRARFARGALGEEAAYLEMEAQLASGNRTTARQLAATLASGTTPNAERAREVLKGDRP